ncbi:uncharacterized protein K02A2.6-like [Leptopilina boulardi]|uniref:uncharacterized protein K02A2.6-like n=1 Tax=Leptopilina boulardi TaxID=63433 RepID=UPI0021F63997|nr:uncharacterized protein K02A2.6-like [Leptopilina boulardi]
MMEEEYKTKLAEATQRQAELQSHIDRLRKERDSSKNRVGELELIVNSNLRQNASGNQNGAEPSFIPPPIQPNVTFVSTIGAMSEFKIGEDWDIYQDRLTQYFIANSVTQPERKVAVLVTLIGQDAYKSLKDLCDPALPSSKTYEELCVILKGQFSKRVSIFRERTEFYELRQNDQESINEWFIRIKNKAATCEFGGLLNDMIKDKFVTGLKKGVILDRVCEEEHTKQLTEILEIARNREAALLNSKREVPVYSVNLRANKNQKNKFSSKSSEDKQEKTKFVTCNHCGGSNHDFKHCKYKKFKCNSCKKIGHLAKICKSKDKQESQNHLTEDEVSCSAIDCDEIFSVNDYKQPFLVDMFIGDVAVKAEIDTGASRSVIPESLYREKLSKFKLEKVETTLRLYDGTIVKPLGQVEVMLSKDDSRNVVKLLVVRRGCRMLLGRDLMSVLGYEITQVNSISDDFKLQDVLQEFKSLFDGTTGKYKYSKVDMNVVDGTKPIFCKPRPVPFAFKDEMTQRIRDLESQGFIKAVDDAEWGTPLVPVLKKDGKIRVCADYKVTINKCLEDVKHPTPRIEELFACVSGGVKFTKLDFTNAFNQLEVTEETAKLLTWSTHLGLFKVNRMPFGPKTCVAIFQKIIEKTLQGIPCVTIFCDDIVVTGKTKDEHLQNLRLVLKKLSDAGFKLNLKKCSFFQDEIHYLGHIINGQGLHKNPEMVEAIRAVKKPENVTELKSFLGMVNYYGKFVPHLGQMLKPLYDATTRQNWTWTTREEAAFNEIKEEIASDRCLVHYDPAKKLKLVADASKDGIGAALLHVFPNGDERPIAFASRILRCSEKNYSVIHKEALAIYWSVCKFYQFLVGNKFMLCSDHKPLLALFGEKNGIPKMAAGRLQRWAVFLSSFDYTLEYIKGIDNGAADGLSRLPRQVSSGVDESMDYFNFIVEENIPIKSDDLRRELRKDPVLSKVFLYVRDGWPTHVDPEFKPFLTRKDEISIDSGLLMWGYRLIIPQVFRSSLLEEIHGGHIGIVKMKALARQLLLVARTGSGHRDFW